MGATTRDGDRIRAAEPADVEVMWTLIRELAEYERLLDQVVLTPESLAQALFGERPAAHAVVAEVDGGIVGVALYFFTFSTFAATQSLYLEDLYVRPSARGRGLGRALMAHLAQVAVARGCARFEWSVLDWNEPALEFYRALGAVAMDEWTVQRLSGDALRRLGAEAGQVQ
jgi:GNAT superfamily N-acetyltransferase